MLTAYNTTTRYILRDANARFWSDTELNQYINEARLQTVIDSNSTRCLLQGVPLTAGTQQYPYSTLANYAITGYSLAGTTLTVTCAGASLPFSAGIQIAIGGVTTPAALNGTWGIATATVGGTSFTIALSAAQAALMVGVYAGAGVVNISILNVMDVYLLFNGTCLALDRYAYSTLGRYLRFYRPFKAPPAAFAVYAQSVWFGPIPDVAYTADFDVVPYPATLVDDTTFEAIPVPFQRMVPFYAAYRAYIAEQSQAKADYMMQQYKVQGAMAMKSQGARKLRHGSFRA